MKRRLDFTVHRNHSISGPDEVAARQIVRSNISVYRDLFRDAGWWR